MSESQTITQIGYKKSGMSARERGGFVKITHPESGISVTKYAVFQIEAREEAQKEMDRLLRIWKG